MPTRRQQQVADAIHKEVSVLIQRELKDPRLGFVTVTRAEVSPDLHYARVSSASWARRRSRRLRYRRCTARRGSCATNWAAA